MVKCFLKTNMFQGIKNLKQFSKSEIHLHSLVVCLFLSLTLTHTHTHAHILERLLGKL